MTPPVISIAKESFPREESEWQPLFDAEGIEICGKPMKLDLDRYVSIEMFNRLVFIAARIYREPIGYCTGYVFSDLHWGDRVAVDDIWYVKPEHRKQGIGSAMKRIMHDHLKAIGATKVYDLIRDNRHPFLMAEYGYTVWGIRWVKEL